MKVAFLAGGLGTRLLEETLIRPKPLVEIGGKPILWHIMRYYSHFGFNEFVVALGYKGELVKRWMEEYYYSKSHVPTEAGSDEVVFRGKSNKDRTDWVVHLVDTGKKTLTGGRIKRLAPWLHDQTFMLTWCDGLADVNIDTLLKFHHSHGCQATVTAVRPPTRFGHLVLSGDRVTKFREKPPTGFGWINGAFFVLEPGVFDYIDGDNTQWEKEPLERLASDRQLMAFRHAGFWQCMDTLREKQKLDELWQSGNAPWKIWKD